jgi:hypothetical protein
MTKWVKSSPRQFLVRLALVEYLLEFTEDDNYIVIRKREGGREDDQRRKKLSFETSGIL